MLRVQPIQAEPFGNNLMAHAISSSFELMDTSIAGGKAEEMGRRGWSS